jgi:hypothetical protein
MLVEVSRAVADGVEYGSGGERGRREQEKGCTRVAQMFVMHSIMGHWV